MTEPVEVGYGSAREYRVTARVESGTGGYFYFSETFFESDDPRFDAILLLGARLNHDYIAASNQNVINSWAWNGFSKKARAINRIFLMEINVAHSTPSFEDIEAGEDYTKTDAVVGTVDHGMASMPDLASEGVLGALSYTQGYNNDSVADDVRTWIHVAQAPKKYTYHKLEITKPLVFYHRTEQYTADKASYVLFKLMAYVRFLASPKANPKFSRGIAMGQVM